MKRNFSFGIVKCIDRISRGGVGVNPMSFVGFSNFNSRIRMNIQRSTFSEIPAYCQLFENPDRCCSTSCSHVYFTELTSV